ncbi:hypothetical protein GCM10009584_26460 [Ornithinimicrobium humiphilum]
MGVEDDRRRRMRTYLVAMGLRIAGFPTSVWLLLHGHLVLGVSLAVFATVVPSIAVVVANAVDRRGATVQDSTPASPVRGLAAADPAPAEPSAPVPAAPIVGTVVSSSTRPAPDTDDEAGREGS